MERIEGIIGNVGELYHWPPFFFHYIIACICVFYVICVCVLKFKYLFWYNQPITFQFTLRRFLRGGDGCMNTSVMNPLSLGKHYNNAVVYPFLHFVDHKNVIVYGGSNKSIIDAPYEKLAAFLSRREIELVAPTRRCGLLTGGDGGEGGERVNGRHEILRGSGGWGLGRFAEIPRERHGLIVDKAESTALVAEVAASVLVAGRRFAGHLVGGGGFCEPLHLVDGDFELLALRCEVLAVEGHEGLSSRGSPPCQVDDVPGIHLRRLDALCITRGEGE